MNSEEINRFNVYTQIFPNNRQNFYLESWDGSVWEPVTYQRNRLNFHSLDSIAKRIVQLSPDNNLYKRIIFANSPLDNRDGRLEGIELHNGEPRLVDSLTRKEKVDLLVKIQKYFSELKKRENISTFLNQ
ncbi:MAG: hypothetical protein KC550_00225 [Nanoarchaeota archaeon]|nr:hypothetical protein [Nanoarchaeota archaeon]